RGRRQSRAGAASCGGAFASFGAADGDPLRQWRSGAGHDGAAAKPSARPGGTGWHHRSRLRRLPAAARSAGRGGLQPACRAFRRGAAFARRARAGGAARRRPCLQRTLCAAFGRGTCDRTVGLRLPALLPWRWRRWRDALADRGADALRPRGGDAQGMTRTALPIDAVLPELVVALRDAGQAVLQAPPGAGKTTRVPLALLDSGLVKGRILMLEPRRVAARAAAERLA